MVRARTLLLSYFPSITQEQASQALRESGGDVEKAKKALEKSALTNKTEKAVDVVGGGGGNIRRSERLPPTTAAVINNLSDRQYCCVWSVEVFDDGYRPEVARSLLAAIARHVNPVLRARGWRVKRLIESASSTWIGCCTGNGRSDADAASTNIQLNLRAAPSKHCTRFRSFRQILAVMLHEITHTSIGLEDIHPPAFYELLDEIRGEYRAKLAGGDVALETDTYGCDGAFVTENGDVTTIAYAARDIIVSTSIDQHGRAADAPSITNHNDDAPAAVLADGDCGVKKRTRRRRRRAGAAATGRSSGGTAKKRSASKAMGMAAAAVNEKRRPLLKGAKMIDKRTVQGKKAVAETASLSARELAARAALARSSQNNNSNRSSDVAVGTLREKETMHVESASAGKSREDTDDDVDEDSNSAGDDNSGDEDEEDEIIQPHKRECACRSCDWDRRLFLPTAP